MNRIAKFLSPLALVAALSFSHTPAQAQFGGGGGGGDMMTTMEPMLEMMKQRMGKKRFAQLMQTMGPMAEKMMGNGGGFGGMGGGFGGMGAGFGSMGGGMGGGMGGFDMGSMSQFVSPAMISSMTSMMPRGGGKSGRKIPRAF